VLLFVITKFVKTANSAVFKYSVNYFFIKILEITNFAQTFRFSLVPRAALGTGDASESLRKLNAISVKKAYFL